MSDGMTESKASEDPSLLWAVTLNITGQVQGVFFRANAATTSERIGVVGYVRNMPDGSVELVAHGSHKQLDEIKTWCHIGPPMAVVTAVEETVPMAPIASIGYKHFRILHHSD